MPRWLAPLIALVAMPLLLLVAVLSVPYLAIVRFLQFVGIIRKPRPTGTLWGTGSSAHAEIFAPDDQGEVVEAVVADIAAAAGTSASMRVEWMRDQGAVIATVSLQAETFDARELMQRVLEAGRLAEVRSL